MYIHCTTYTYGIQTEKSECNCQCMCLHSHTTIMLYIGGNIGVGLLYVAWADQRHRQCCIRHTEHFLNGTVLYDGRRPNLRFSKVWRAHQRVRQPGEPQDACFSPLTSAKIGRTLAQFLNGTVLYDGRARRGRPNLRFSKVWPTQQHVRQPQDAFASCFNPLASAKIGRSILTLAACDLSPVDSLRLLPGAFESPTSLL